MSSENEEPTSSSDYMGIDMDQRPSSPPTSPLTSPEPPRWRFVNAAKKAAGYGSEWKVQSAGGADGTASADDDGKAILDAARNARNAWKERESVNGSKPTTEDNKVDLSSGWSGGVSSGVLHVVSKDEQDVNGDVDAQPQLEPLQPAEATDESSFDNAIDDASAQQRQHSETKLDETFDTANDEGVVSTDGGWRGVVTETYKSFDELQTREGERLEEPPLALPDEVRGMMHTLGQMLYYGNNNNDDDDEEDEEVEQAVARPAVDAEETRAEAAEVESMAKEQENETTEEADEVPVQDDAAAPEIKAEDEDEDELDQVEKQELNDVDLATEETPSVEHSASNDEQQLAKKDTAATNEHQPTSRRKKWIVFILVLAVIAIAAVVLGVIFAGNKSTDDGTCLVDGEECVPNNCQSWTCGDTDCCCCGGLTCLADTRAGFGRPVCG